MSADSDEDRTLIGAPVVDDHSPPPAAMIHLLVLDQPGAPPHRVPLGPEPLTIGRTVQNGLMLASDEISRQHCVVALQDGVAIVTDMGSTNGCWIGGKRIEGPTSLPPGSVLRVGPYHLQYLCLPRQEMERNQGLERDLEKAQRYVTALLPAPIAEGPVRADWRFVPSAQIGGDGFGWRFLDDRRFAVWLLDVAGHGAGAALLAASVMNTLRSGGPAGADPADPAAVLAGLNALFQSDRQGGLYFSCWHGVADLTARTLCFAGAGHHPGWLLAPGAPAWAALHVRNPGIGLTAEWPYRSAVVPLPPASRLVLFSNGAFDTAAADGTRRGLADFLPHLATPPVPGLPEAERLLNAVMQSVAPHGLDDDVSILSLDFD
ncbi:SpoIIE family protein phosphatase [Humitalea sp. 24SJ18S-53]|uniref:SpoIIE family protein phosphatase n=1 Tax=Humitalea sp. 24SJ18S-53 TaxID=3422307 RepID=UPI003D67DD07